MSYLIDFRSLHCSKLPWKNHLNCTAYTRFVKLRNKENFPNRTFIWCSYRKQLTFNSDTCYDGASTAYSSMHPFGIKWRCFCLWVQLNRPTLFILLIPHLRYLMCSSLLPHYMFVSVFPRSFCYWVYYLWPWLLLHLPMGGQGNGLRSLSHSRYSPFKVDNTGMTTPSLITVVRCIVCVVGSLLATPPHQCIWCVCLCVCGGFSVGHRPLLADGCCGSTDSSQLVRHPESSQSSQSRWVALILH